MIIQFHNKTLNEAKALCEALKDFDDSKNTVLKCYIAIIIETLRDKL
jgi:hypothetical protein